MQNIRRKRVAIFGGSFNPPHYGHLLMAETAREQAELDEIWWVPAADPPHPTAKYLAPGKARMEMVRLAIEDHPAFFGSNLELVRGGKSYTVETLRHFNEAYPENDFFLLIGGDSFSTFQNWYEPAEIASRASLLVYDRPGTVDPQLPTYLSGRIQRLNAPLLHHSSTEIRARIQSGRSVRYMVPEPVRAYVASSLLYVQ